MFLFYFFPEETLYLHSFCFVLRNRLIILQPIYLQDTHTAHAALSSVYFAHLQFSDLGVK